MNKQAEKNKKISESLSKTRAKRLNQECKVFDLKIIQNKLNLNQKEALKRVFLEAKWLKNDIIASDNINKYDSKTKSVLVKKPNGEFEHRNLRIIAAQIKQTVLTQVKSNLKTLATQKQNGRKVGKLRFVKQVNSIDLKQYGVSYKFKSATKVKIQGIPGYVKVRGSEQLQGYELANAKLVRKPSGYYLQITAFKNKSETQQTYQSESKVGLDMGVKTHITLSNGEKFNVLIGETGRLKRLQRKLSKQVKGSNNYHKTTGEVASNRYEKTKRKLHRTYAKITNQELDFAHKLSKKLVDEYEIIGLEDLNVAGMMKNRKLSRRIAHASFGRLRIFTKYKSEWYGSELIMVDRWYPSSKTCSKCGTVKAKLSLKERVYYCESSDCDLVMDRDLNAALNIRKQAAQSCGEALNGQGDESAGLVDVLSSETGSLRTDKLNILTSV